MTNRGLPLSGGLCFIPHTESASILLMFETKCFGRLVAYLGRPEILNRTGIYITRFSSPLLTLRHKIFERSSVEFHQSLLYHRFHLSVTTFHIHHHRNRHASGNPLFGRTSRIAYRRHITRAAFTDKHGRRISQRIAIVGIEIRGRCTTAFISEK